MPLLTRGLRPVVITFSVNGTSPTAMEGVDEAKSKLNRTVIRYLFIFLSKVNL